MALFKIFKGKAENLPLDIHEGYAYLTTDTGELYVDVDASTRKQINAEKLSRTKDGLTETIEIDDLILMQDQIEDINNQLSNGVLPAGGSDGQVLKRKGTNEVEFGLAEQIEDVVNQKPISFKVTGIEGEEFTIEFTEDGEGCSGGVESFNGRSGAVVPQTGDYTAEMVGADTSGSAAQALADAKQYTDDEIKKIPTPDVSAQIQAHNIAGDTHNDIRTLVNDHIANKSNPHSVTAAQIGAAAATHQHAATNITSGTFAPARIPNLAASKINSGTFSVARGGTGLSSLTSGSFLRGNGTGAVSLTTLAQLKSELGIGGGKTATKYSETLRNITMSQDSQRVINFSPSALSGQSWKIVARFTVNNKNDWDYLYSLKLRVGHDSSSTFGAQFPIYVDLNATLAGKVRSVEIGFLSLENISDSFKVDNGIVGIAYAIGTSNGTSVSINTNPGYTQTATVTFVESRERDWYDLTKGAKVSYYANWSSSRVSASPEITGITLYSYKYN